ncbi:DUF3017 domain-containing protein [Streptomyces sp. NPDC001083]|uniref:DUF3017 domain-containing protein n=1 Tax=Streptomyces sp. NPDC001083 TaxID=3364545 RepID=UPI0036B45C23
MTGGGASASAVAKSAAGGREPASRVRTSGAAVREAGAETEEAVRSGGEAPEGAGPADDTDAAGAEAGAVSGGGEAGAGDGNDDPVTVDAVSAPDAEGRPRRTTRRFPLFTRDTAPPEGGGRAASGDAPAPARQWPILAVLAAVGLGLLLVALDAFRFGTILIGAALLAGAVMRWMLPDVGMLAVRSRFTDMVTYGVLGLAIVLLALMAQPNPWLVIPFLDDTLHFTVR